MHTEQFRTAYLQATFSKLLTYCVLRLTQPPTLNGAGKDVGFGAKA